MTLVDGNYGIFLIIGNAAILGSPIFGNSISSTKREIDMSGIPNPRTLPVGTLHQSNYRFNEFCSKQLNEHPENRFVGLQV